MIIMGASQTTLTHLVGAEASLPLEGADGIFPLLLALPLPKLLKLLLLPPPPIELVDVLLLLLLFWEEGTMGGLWDDDCCLVVMMVMVEMGNVVEE